MRKSTYFLQKKQRDAVENQDCRPTFLRDETLHTESNSELMNLKLNKFWQEWEINVCGRDSVPSLSLSLFRFLHFSSSYDIKNCMVASPSERKNVRSSVKKCRKNGLFSIQGLLKKMPSTQQWGIFHLLLLFSVFQGWKKKFFFLKKRHYNCSVGNTVSKSKNLRRCFLLHADMTCIMKAENRTWKIRKGERVKGNIVFSIFPGGKYLHFKTSLEENVYHPSSCDFTVRYIQMAAPKADLSALFQLLLRIHVLYIQEESGTLFLLPCTALYVYCIRSPPP